MNKLLIDISTQELPYKFLPYAQGALENSFDSVFKKYDVKFEELKVFTSPRHLVILASGLNKNEEDIKTEVRGPILKIAKDENGEFTQAAIGFAKKNGMDVSELTIKDDYIWATIIKKSISIEEILLDEIPRIIKSLQAPHFMRWADNEFKFQRPIEDFAVLYNDKVLDIEIFGVKASRKTLGHRFSTKPEFEIQSIDTYLDEMRAQCVIVDQNERKEIIIDSSNKVAEKLGAVIDFASYKELLEELVYITEYPNPVVCEFEEKYLEIPDIVSTTVMSKHQRYIPLYSKDGSLMNKFITISNSIGTIGEDNIKNGNQRVVRARLEDGIFFFKEDTKYPLADKFEDLKGMTFQKNLGSLYDKTLRLEKISNYIAEKLALNEIDKKNVLRCAHLAKIDLSTQLVFEFTELQGFIGEVYAKKSGEVTSVATGIKEHYFPLASGSKQAETIEGQVVGIADKIDTFCAMFASTQDNKKKRPTGSNDPLGVRRAIIGIISTIIDNKLDINLLDLINYNLELLKDEFSLSISDELKADLSDFILGRLQIMLQQEYNRPVIDSTLSGALENLVKYKEKLEFVKNIQNFENFAQISDNFNRVIRITKDFVANKDVNTSLFENSSEGDLYSEIKSNSLEKEEDFNSLSNKIAEFFDKTLVMVENEAVKSNRLTLLSAVKSKLDLICDFSKLTA